MRVCLAPASDRVGSNNAAYVQFNSLQTLMFERCIQGSRRYIVDRRIFRQGPGFGDRIARHIGRGRASQVDAPRAASDRIPLDCPFTVEEDTMDAVPDRVVMHPPLFWPPSEHLPALVHELGN